MTNLDIQNHTSISLHASFLQQDLNQQRFTERGLFKTSSFSGSCKNSGAEHLQTTTGNFRGIFLISNFDAEHFVRTQNVSPYLTDLSNFCTNITTKQ